MRRKKEKMGGGWGLYSTRFNPMVHCLAACISEPSNWMTTNGTRQPSNSGMRLTRISGCRVRHAEAKLGRLGEAVRQEGGPGV